MKLSESLRKGIMETSVGGIINKFKVSKRRDTFFFEELLARYISECEKSGFTDETRIMGEKWGYLCSKILVPDTIKKIPSVFLLNNLVKNIWHNLGLVDDLYVDKDGDVLTLKTSRESITRFIGTNNLTVGFYMGTFNVLFDSSVAPIKVKQSKDACEYTFKLQGKPVSIEGRPKDVYMKLNYIAPARGHTFKDALKKNTFSYRENRIYFRNKLISPVENTLFHTIGKMNILPEKMTETSRAFFDEIIKKDTNKEKKISTLKNLFQLMGWGIVNIVVKKNGNIVIEIRNPPHSLSIDDNWDYIFRTFLGFLHTFDKKLKMTSVKVAERHASVEYSH